MRQKKLVRKLYQACVAHDQGRIEQLRREEFLKIFPRRVKGQLFTPRWTVVSV